jgi:hypothetical protein
MRCDAGPPPEQSIIASSHSAEKDAGLGCGSSKSIDLADPYPSGDHMTTTSPEDNKTLVLKAFDTLLIDVTTSP